MVVVDDSASIDQEVFNMEAYEGADWVRITDEVPVDTDALDTALERFQTLRTRPSASRPRRPSSSRPPTMRSRKRRSSSRIPIRRRSSE